MMKERICVLLIYYNMIIINITKGTYWHSPDPFRFSLGSTEMVETLIYVRFLESVLFASEAPPPSRFARETIILCLLTRLMLDNPTKPTVIITTSTELYGKL